MGGLEEDLEDKSAAASEGVHLVIGTRASNDYFREMSAACRRESYMWEMHDRR